jgi:FlaA1/EpsC-like NDP-sugar epimerase
MIIAISIIYPALQGRSLNEIRIYPPEHLAKVLHKHQITDILLAIPLATPKRRNAVIANLRILPVRVQTLPGFADLAHGRVSLNDLHELDIVDLLGRDSVKPNADLLGKNLALYTIHQELAKRDQIPGQTMTKILALLALVRDERRMTEIIKTWRPDPVYHAAAYKHVPMVEHNVVEGIRNNVFGTLTTARIARGYGVSISSWSAPTRLFDRQMSWELASGLPK